MIPLTESLLVVSHHCDAHSSEQPGKITSSSKDLHLYLSSSFKVSSYFANLLYFLLASFDSCRYLSTLIWLGVEDGAKQGNKEDMKEPLCMYEWAIRSCLVAHLGFLGSEVKCYFWETMQLLRTVDWKHPPQHSYIFMPERAIVKMSVK